MAGSCIDIEYKSEERYSKIAIAFTEQEEYKEISEAIDEVNKEFPLESTSYVTDVSHGKKVIVVEYHDDFDRQAANIVDALMKRLDITTCS